MPKTSRQRIALPQSRRLQVAVTLSVCGREQHRSLLPKTNKKICQIQWLTVIRERIQRRCLEEDLWTVTSSGQAQLRNINK